MSSSNINRVFLNDEYIVISSFEIGNDYQNKYILNNLNDENIDKVINDSVNEKFKFINHY